MLDMIVNHAVVQTLLKSVGAYPHNQQPLLRAALLELVQLKELEENKHLAFKIGQEVVYSLVGDLARIFGKVTARNADKRYTVEWSDGSVTTNLPESRLDYGDKFHKPKAAAPTEEKDLTMGDPVVVRCDCNPRPAEFLEYRNDKKSILARFADGAYIQAPVDHFKQPDQRRSAEISFDVATDKTYNPNGAFEVGDRINFTYDPTICGTVVKLLPDNPTHKIHVLDDEGRRCHTNADQLKRSYEGTLLNRRIKSLIHQRSYIERFEKPIPVNTMSRLTNMISDSWAALSDIGQEEVRRWCSCQNITI